MGNASKIFVTLCCLVCVYAFFAAVFYRGYWNALNNTDVNGLSSTLLSWDAYMSSSSTALTKSWLLQQSLHLKSNTPAVEMVNMSTFEPFSIYSGVNIWDLFPPEFSCPDLTRIGNIGDGGKWVCGSTWLGNKDPRLFSAPRKRCVLYSYGVSTDSSFEQEMVARHNCHVFAFDPTIGRMKIPPQHSSSIRYHKMGIWNSSGSTASFLLVEHLFDAMLRLNHSYVDILKVDIEGAEWPVFRDLLQSRAMQSASPGASSDSRLRLPFGQLLIELHFESVSTTVEFFRGLASHGFRAFSREINLQPCLSGQKPVAVEYSFINPSVFFSPLSTIQQSLPPAVTPAWHRPIKAVIYFLTRRARVARMQIALQSLYANFLVEYPLYPVLIFHDDLSTADESRMRSSVPQMQLTFIRIHLSLPLHMSPAQVPRMVPHCSPNSSTVGYRHMIMFHATGVHQYLMDKANGFSDTEFLLRLDDDSIFTAPVGYDLFKLMQQNNLSYGFVNTVQDDAGCVLGLWNHTKDFMRKLNQSRPSAGLAGTIADENLVSFSNWTEGRVIYNNFELSRLSVWQSRLWRDFMQSVDLSGKVYTHRWGDAPLHTIFVLLGLSSREVHAFTDLAYRHDPFVHQPPSGLPMPGANPFAQHTFGCTYYSGWRCSVMNSTNVTLFGYGTDGQLLIPPGPLSPLWGSDRSIATARLSAAIEAETQRKIRWSSSSDDGTEINDGMTTGRHTRSNHRHRHTRDSKDKPDNSRSRHNASKIDTGASRRWWLRGRIHSTSKDVVGGTALLEKNSSNQRDVMYTFGHVDRMDYLAGTLSNMYAQYARTWNCRIVVFHTHTFNSSAISHVNQMLADAGAVALLSFELVDLSDYEQRVDAPGSSAVCGSRDAETAAASRFLMRDALHRLEAMGFEWFFRVADNARFLEPVRYSVFERLRRNGMKYGFISIVRDNPTCVEGLWLSRRRICAAIGHCSDLADAWPEGVVVFTNFEISHRSVWQSEVFSRLMHETDQASGVVWGDAAVHTVSVISTLRQDEIHHFEDIRYEALMNPKGASDQSDGGKDLWVEGVKMDTLDQTFRPRRFGWLGGDVASSFALPPLSCHPSLAGTDRSGRLCGYNDSTLSNYIWLFGDSLVGTSTVDRRIEGELVPNSVAMVQLADAPEVPGGARAVKSVNYYWTSDQKGSPAAVFDSDKLFAHAIMERRRYLEEDSTEGQLPPQYRFWPYSGITIFSSPTEPLVAKSHGASNGRVLVIGQLVESIRWDTEAEVIAKAAGSLSFREVMTAGVVISRPYDPPDMWIHSSSPLSLPSQLRGGGSLSWITLAVASGRPFATEDEMLYMVGIYDKQGVSADNSSASRNTIIADSNLFDIFAVSRRHKVQVVGRVRARDALVGALGNFELLVPSDWTQSSATGSSRGVFVSLNQLDAHGSSEGGSPVAILPGVVSEASLHFDAKTQRWIVVSLDISENGHRVCYSTDISITSSWRCFSVSGIGAPWNDRHRFITYAGRAHPELDPQQGKRRVVSYATNLLSGPNDLFLEKHKHAYCPLFLEYALP